VAINPKAKPDSPCTRPDSAPTSTISGSMYVACTAELPKPHTLLIRRRPIIERAVRCRSN
jgi:hypothetical protein